MNGAARLWRRIEPTLPFALTAASLAAWSASGRTFVDVLLALGAVHQLLLVFAARGDRVRGVHASGALLLAGLLAVDLVGPRSVLLLLPAGFAYLFVGLGLAQNASVRERAARALRGRRIPADESATAWARDRAALGLVLPTCAVAVLLVPLATFTIQFRLPTFDGVAPPPPDGRAPPAVVAPAAHGPAAEKPDSSPDPQAPGAVFLEVAPTRGDESTGDLGAIYLRGLPLVDDGGRWREDLSGLRTVDDAVDGQADGWCTLRPRPPADDAVTLDVHALRVERAPTGEAVVWCAPGTSAVELPRVRASPGGVVLAPLDRAADVLDYRVIATSPARVAHPRPGARVVKRPRPPAGAAVVPTPERLESAALRAAGEADDDLGRVRAVMRHLRRNYLYERIDGRFDPADGLAKFAAEGHGTCLQFAEAGVVMLRTIGIPARIGRGFLAEQWSDEQQAYVVRVRDAHAWVEVEFEGVGYSIFDPTPHGDDGRPDDPSSNAEPTPAPPPPPATDETPPPPEGAKSRLGDALTDVRDSLASAWDWIVGHPWIGLAAAAVAAALAVRSSRRRARLLAGETVDAPVARGPWERLLAELARRGYRRQPSQTASEFAAYVVAVGGETFRPFLDLTARRQAARFGGRPLSPDDDRAFDAFRAAM